MRAIYRVIYIILPIVLTGWLAAAQVKASNNTYTMSGRISAINTDAGTVVVQVPVKNNQMMTVAGPVVKKATLKKKGRKIDLGGFQVGDHVQITWQKTDKTLLIKRLIAT